MNISAHISILLFIFVSTALVGQTDDYPSRVENRAYDTILVSESGLSLDSLFKNLYEHAYIDATVDTIRTDTSELFQIVRGDQYRYGDVALDTSWQGATYADFTASFFYDKGFEKKYFDTWSDSIFTHLSRNGYPLASIYPVDIDVHHKKVNLVFGLEKGSLVVFDTLAIERKGYVNAKLVAHVLGIRAGAPYDESMVKDIERKLIGSRYYALRGDPTVSIVDNKAVVQMLIEKRPSSRFDFIIGVLPNQQNTGPRYRITGDLLIETRNILDRGEYFFLNLKRTSLTDQNLKIKASYPYLFGLPYELSGELGIDKNASNFLNVDSRLGLFAQVGRYTRLGLSALYKQSSLIEIDTQVIVSSSRLPSALDTRYTGAVGDIVVSTLDNTILPRHGLHIALSPQMGKKRIIANQKIRSLSSDDTDFSMAYDSLQRSPIQGRVDAEIAYYYPIISSLGLKISAHAGFILDEKILRNELYRIGGYRLLRGFDEASIYTDRYLVFSAENRFILGPYSYLSLPFVDFSYAHVAQGETMIWDDALGFGMGMSFATKVGIFNLSFAAGRRLNNPINFNQVKVHFGYVSTF